MKHLILLLLLFNISPAHSQKVDKTNPSKLTKEKSFSIGIATQFVLRGNSDLYYSFNTSGYTEHEQSNKSLTHLYRLNLGYSFRNSFIRVSTGITMDYINFNLEAHSVSGNFDVGDNYSINRTSTNINVKERNRAFSLGTEFGGFVASKKSMAIGGAIGLHYTYPYQNKIIVNEFTGTYSNSFNSPSGSGLTSGTYSHDNESSIWKHRVKKTNSAYIAPSLNLLLKWEVSDQMLVEFRIAKQFLFKLDNGTISRIKVQFPLGIGVHYELF